MAADTMGVEREDQENTVPAKKRKLTKAAEAKLKAEQKKKKGSDDEEDDDACTALSKSLWSNGATKPSVGSFEDCAVCEKQFTVVCCIFLSCLAVFLMKPIFRLNTPCLPTLAQVSSATNVQRQVETILSRRRLLRRNAGRQQTRGISLLSRKRDLLPSFRFAFRLDKRLPLPGSTLNQ